jgi:molecular chaperone GrpE
MKKTRKKGRKTATSSASAKEEAQAAAATDDPADEPRAEDEDEPTVEDETRTEDRLGELEDELARVREEATQAADRALRTLAEFDNYRRRSEREREAATARGASEVLTGLLDVADNFDRALEHADGDIPESFLEGMQLVARGLHDLLGRHGVVRIEAVGVPFDPEVHEALTSQPSADAPPNTVLQEIQPGYKMGDRVLRPAKVIVAAAAGNERSS